ncbi:hypothetical protein [Piscirickettsia litoralis]|uniref:Uncharacterized protein n=1 Tax=Piscirickettsia litoralis TaxID=1891921 RepID=A0ABX3A4V7_9GAMM|nr:hypothetical protein [Piscirickettsia litoralis]ODN43458.1 hypothetical protein BGC07_11675 [Piscirickettsia litoralis]
MKLTTLYGGIVANAASLPFTQASGWKTTLEEGIYSGHEQLAKLVEPVTWGTAVGGAFAGFGVSLLGSKTNPLESPILVNESSQIFKERAESKQQNKSKNNDVIIDMGM